MNHVRLECVETCIIYQCINVQCGMKESQLYQMFVILHVYVARSRPTPSPKPQYALTAFLSNTSTMYYARSKQPRSLRAPCGSKIALVLVVVVYLTMYGVAGMQ